MYDYYFVKQASGQWSEWVDYLDKEKCILPKEAKGKVIVIAGFILEH